MVEATRLQLPLVVVQVATRTPERDTTLTKDKLIQQQQKKMNEK